MTKKTTPTPDEAPEAVAPEPTVAESKEAEHVDATEAAPEPPVEGEVATAGAEGDDAGGEEDGTEAGLQEELDQLNDRHLRLAAEFTNYRRRAEGERVEIWSRAQADMVRKFADALDDLQRVGAWQADATTVEALVEGVDLVERKFRQALEAAGVEVLDPVGERFDPNTMEAMMRVPADSDEEDDMVHDVMQKGYMLKGHLVRPARVSVKKH